MHWLFTADVCNRSEVDAASVFFPIAIADWIQSTTATNFRSGRYRNGSFLLVLDHRFIVGIGSGGCLAYHL